MTIDKTILARARPALAHSRALDSGDAPSVEPGGTLAAINAGAAVENCPVGVERAIVGGARPRAGTPADGGCDDSGAGVTDGIAGNGVSGVREAPALGARNPNDCGSAPEDDAAFGASASNAFNFAAQVGPGSAAAPRAPVVASADYVLMWTGLLLRSRLVLPSMDRTRHAVHALLP